MGHNILAIDDSQTLRRFIENSLSQRSAEYTVITAPDAEQGLQRAMENRPDLILLDFLLPDMNGDAVCRQLIDQGYGEIPVILLSSDAREMQKAEKELENVTRCLTKPFTRDLLNATVSHAIREIEAGKGEAATPAAQAAKPAAAGAGEIVFRSTSSMTSLISALRGIANNRFTGRLTCSLDDGTEIFVLMNHGLPQVCSTRDGDLYLASDLYQLNIPDDVLNEVKEEQSRKGFPCFAVLGQQDLLERDQVLLLCKEYGNALFARVWTAAQAKYVFETDNLPGWLDYFPVHKGRIDDWAMSTLRQVGKEYQSAQAWGQPNGIPCFTLRGYRSLQEIPLNDKEIGFASLVSEGGLTLEEIANRLEMSVESAERILYRFMTMEVIDYWPGSIFKGDRSEEDEDAGQS